MALVTLSYEDGNILPDINVYHFQQKFVSFGIMKNFDFLRHVCVLQLGRTMLISILHRCNLIHFLLNNLS